jgi:hypothetical protein
MPHIDLAGAANAGLATGFIAREGQPAFILVKPVSTMKRKYMKTDGILVEKYK